MIEILKYEATHLSNTSIEITWKFHPTPESINDYIVVIFGGSSPDNMKKISSDLPADVYSFIEYLEKPRPYNENFYYRIEYFLTTEPINIKKTINFLTLPPIDPIAAELINKEELKLRFTGKKCAIYVRLKNDSGIRCAYCWDEITRRVVDKTCKHCGGTGFWGGYHPVIYKNINISQDNYQMMDNGQTGKTGELSAIIELGAHPKLSLNDLIVEDNKGLVWRLVSHAGSEIAKLRNHTKQVWQAKSADRGIIEDIKKYNL